jgi:phosphatidylserine/phosphatidylglycerophosphate/cardiolipin synthase-like enzyme
MNVSSLSVAANTNGQCQSNCVVGSGVKGLNLIVEPDAGLSPIVNAIRDARQAVWLEIYLLTNKSVLTALEDDANRGIDVRVMLEQHPYGSSGVSSQETIAKLQAAGVKAQSSNPAFTLTHEKSMIIDRSTVYIMTSNMTNTALGVGNYSHNREYDIIDTQAQDVQAAMAIFQADWERNVPSFYDPNLVVSPLNSRTAFNTLIAHARQTLLVTSEEMKDSGIEQDLTAAARRGVRVQVILPAPTGPPGSDQDSDLASILRGGVEVREDPQLYMHAKIFVVDGQTAFVGSENISSQSLDQNRELGIIVADRNALTTLQRTFQHDWNASSTVHSSPPV